MVTVVQRLLTLRVGGGALDQSFDDLVERTLEYALDVEHGAVRIVRNETHSGRARKLFGDWEVLILFELRTAQPASDVRARLRNLAQDPAALASQWNERWAHTDKGTRWSVSDVVVVEEEAADTLWHAWRDELWPDLATQQPSTSGTVTGGSTGTVLVVIFLFVIAILLGLWYRAHWRKSTADKFHLQKTAALEEEITSMRGQLATVPDAAQGPSSVTGKIAEQARRLSAQLFGKRSSIDEAPARSGSQNAPADPPLDMWPEDDNKSGKSADDADDDEEEEEAV